MPTSSAIMDIDRLLLHAASLPCPKHVAVALVRPCGPCRLLVAASEVCFPQSSPHLTPHIQQARVVATRQYCLHLWVTTCALSGTFVCETMNISKLLERIVRQGTPNLPEMSSRDCVPCLTNKHQHVSIPASRRHPLASISGNMDIAASFPSRPALYRHHCKHIGQSTWCDWQAAPAKPL